MNLIHLADLKSADIYSIWSLVGSASSYEGSVAWSFEGNGIRTRTTFIKAFQELGLSYIELPNLLKTSERVEDLAGYLDPFYLLYVIRESSHSRLMEFANASERPVINAMSSQGHPCEVLADAYYIETSICPIKKARICLWGPTTNVLRSWHELAEILDIEIVHICDPTFHERKENVCFSESPGGAVDVIITDAWPAGYHDQAWSLNSSHLEALGQPRLLPTPPFTIGEEVATDPLEYKGFTGYQQKMALLSVQKAIVQYMIAG
ncbi:MULTISPECIES: ornithine carbamoyltransferase [Pseudomonas]|uniref:Aspartate/ornithine carbamoyltransferase carbamoyl-P binding domain-containing protein n=1 Tax=Pseudomonas luteola TaxID=47886 RepID=A0ABS0MXG9_PSELU|nr:MULTISPECIES: ornithine carbamoyltransferase [Pseudomonas]MBA1250298.1 ornithine carbamoyltransferase [Pseudomonas zeshuii]MBH3441413.1 hypothetical protein [Pseudomonas luteola]RRW40338.1 ornithine carbamoyltransferase [Pseudomonas luteola]